MKLSVYFASPQRCIVSRSLGWRISLFSVFWISFYNIKKEVKALKVVQVDINWWCNTPSSLAGTKAIFLASKEVQRLSQAFS